MTSHSRGDRPLPPEKFPPVMAALVQASGGAVVSQRLSGVRTYVGWELASAEPSGTGITKLPERAALFAALIRQAPMPDQVFFRSPLCVGFSATHAQDTIEAIWSRRALVYVQTLDVLLRAGDDITSMREQITREAKATHQADWRKRKP